MLIRPLVTGDTARLLEFYDSLPEAITRFFLPFGDVNETVLRAHLSGAEEERHISLGVVGEAGDIRGHGFILCVDTGQPVFGIGLHDDLIGRGWGRRLMEATLCEADSRKLPLVSLTVVKVNHRALRLYEKMGFCIRGESTFRAQDDSWYMERRRPPDWP